MFREVLLKCEGLLEIVYEFFECFEVYLCVESLFMVTANVRGDFSEVVAVKFNSVVMLCGL